MSDCPSLPNARLLVVDDNEDNRYTLALYLNLEGYTRVDTARDGSEAIARLQTESFDLVLLDIMMPNIDGYQVLTWLKETDRLHHLPVIMISAISEMSSVVRCIELGAVDYLLKPFNPVLLRARLNASLEQKRLRDQIRTHLARLEAELESARLLQIGMLPQTFPTPSRICPIDLYATMEPAREVGGDLFDFFHTEDGTLCFFVGDVSGKGMPAALFMARTKSLIRIITELLRGAGVGMAEPAGIIARVNRELCQNNDAMMFVTLFFGMLNPSTGDVVFCNAGHNAPHRISGGMVSTVEDARGLILGVEPDATYVTGSLTLAFGEMLYLFTDGVTEATNPEDAMFGEERLENVLRTLHDQSSNRIIEGVAKAVRDFAGAAEQSDDVTMLALRRIARAEEIAA